ncbi:ATP-grasp domain-containing protein [Amycolatopsis pretoriensis]|uniref:ATP-grasp domain-containing protein n=1 Tax=Amycolatopsis pretoriensis TaxID=218821 RepID=A0A1H5Q4F8_9PSEU|nr:ATP-grasp domain-containing protein [Amycolatopsis pretoriensis]SEF21010.1 ATP-grasp domain-containing protein [Amycolatopsis pretoriensis]
MSNNIFVVGLDEENQRVLQRLPWAGTYEFHGLLTPEELQHGEIDFEALLKTAQHQLDAFDGDVAAIVTYWDFPAATLVPILCARYGLPSLSLEAVLKCEHKYWSRLEQRKVIDELPNFGVVDLDDEHPAPPRGVGFPMWLKPVKSFSSELAFKADDETEFADAVAEIRAGVGRVGEPFGYVLDQVQLPPEIAQVGGAACLAEEALHGVQAAVEGYVYHGEVVVYGALDSINYPDSSSFLRHQYPSQLAEEPVRRMREVAERVMRQIGYDNGTFSIEFFCDPESGQVALLEINPRHSQSHAELFEFVDGVANHEIMVRLGLGQDPGRRPSKGKYQIAGKWYLRRFEDGVVTRVPTREEVAAIEDRIDGTQIEIVPTAGQRLSELPEQDSYSFELAQLFVAAHTEHEMTQKYDACVDALRFEFDEG